MAVSVKCRFQGCIVGAVIGDCLGNYWEMRPWKGTHDIEEVRAKIIEQLSQYKKGKSPLVGYTDDTAMTLEMAKSLVECKGLDPKDMARRFTEEFYKSPERGYGASVSTVFIDLKNTRYQDAFAPAQKSFKGQGSCGNGSAMRISPAALFGYKDEKTLIETVRDTSRITHAHISGINGALLQALAIRQAMEATPTQPLNIAEFIERLYGKMAEFEHGFDSVVEEDGKGDSKDTGPPQLPPLSPSAPPPDPKSIKVKLLKGQPRYTSILEQIRALLLRPDATPTADEVQTLLGHGVLSAEAVPCALYAFLHCSGKSFEELIPFAISLGGDADTIASMAGAIGGAYWGHECIPNEWVESCEATSQACSLAADLYQLVDLPTHD